MEMLEDNTTMVDIMDNTTTTEPTATEATSPSPAPTSLQGPVTLIDDLPRMTVDEVILSDPDTTTLAAAFKASGLLGVLCENCNYTVFAYVLKNYDCAFQSRNAEPNNNNNSARRLTWFL